MFALSTLQTLLAIGGGAMLVLLAGWAIHAVIGNRRRGKSGAGDGELSAEVIEALEPIIHPDHGD